MGKFKVGKSFIVDYIRDDTKTLADSLLNTIGINVWYDEEYAIFDTEGLMQPVGENNVYFVKQFLTSFMLKSADTLVYVSDQMDVIDLDFYKFFKAYFIGGSIKEMFHIHNCKTLDPEKLKRYSLRIKDLLSLDKQYVDKECKNKPVQHLFLPKIEVNTLGSWFNNLVNGKKKIDFLGSSILRRENTTTFSYLQSVNEGLLSLGSPALNSFNSKTLEISHNGFRPVDVKMIPINFKWCKMTQQDTKVYLYLETNRILSLDYSILGELAIKMKVLGNSFKTLDIVTTLSVPISIINHKQVPWKCFETGHGYSVVEFEYAANRNDPEFDTCLHDNAIIANECNVVGERVALLSVVINTINIMIDLAKPFIELFNDLREL